MRYPCILILTTFINESLSLHFNASCLPDFIEQGVYMESWMNLVSGNQVEELESLAAYPHNPDRAVTAMNFFVHQYVNSTRGHRARAYFQAPMDGWFQFSFMCDFQCRFNMKSDEDFSESLLSFKVPRTPSYQKYQHPVELIQNKLYFIEILHVQTKTGGYFGVGVNLPNGSSIMPVTRDFLAVYVPEPERTLAEPGSWGSWSPCSVTCGNGIQSRWRTCTNPPAGLFKGLNSDVTPTETRSCFNSSCPACLTGWFHFDRSCYFISSTKYQHGQVGKMCLSYNALLSRITSDDENDFIVSLMNQAHVWIDAHYRHSESVSEYGDGTIAEYTNWDSNEPDNDPQRSCVALERSSHKWEAKRCSETRFFVCEKEEYNDSSSCGNRPVGMESGRIPDSDITSPHTYGSSLVDARLGHGLQGWCGVSGKPYIQIDLQNIFRLCAVATQGSYPGHTVYTTSYVLSLSVDGNSWDYYQDENSQLKVFTGNVDAYSVVKNELFVPEVGASSIRFELWTYSHTFGCLRVEIYGYKQILPRGPSQAPQPTNLHFTLQESLSFSWNRILTYFMYGTIHGYKIRYYKAEDSSSVLTNRTVNNYIVIQGLSVNTNYCMSVATYNEHGISNYSYPLCAMTDEGVPIAQPSNVTAFSTSSWSLKVVWSPLSKDLAQGTVTGYKIRVFSGLGVSLSEYEVKVPGLMFDIHDLDPFTLYCIQVLAETKYGPEPENNLTCVNVTTDEHGASVLDGTKAYGILEAVNVPTAPPSNIVVQNTSSTSLLVSWEEVPFDQQQGIIRGYTVFYGKAVDPDWTNKSVSSDMIKEVELTSLQIYTTYCIMMLAFTRKGDGLLSPECVYGLTDDDVPGMPPEFTSVRNTSSTSLEITWQTVPAEFANGQILGFGVTYRKENEVHQVNLLQCSEMFSLSLSNLSIFTNYCLQLSAFTRKGESNSSLCVYVSTDEDVPGSPPENLTVYNSSSTSIVASWDPVPKHLQHGFILGYLFYLTDAVQHHSRRKKREIISVENEIFGENMNLTTEFVGLEMFSNYCVQAAAFTRVGESNVTSPSCAFTDEDVPSQAPDNITGLSTGPTSIHVEWNSIDDQVIRGILLGYKLFFGKSSEPHSTYQYRILSPESLSHELSGLMSFTEYCTRVAGFTRIGTGPMTACVNVTTDQGVLSTAPHPVAASVLESPHMINFTWGPPLQSETTATLLGYKVVYQQTRKSAEPVTDSEELTQVIAANQTFFGLSGLSTFSAFTFKVAGVTVTGDGPFSQTVQGETCRCKKYMETAFQPSPLDKDGKLSNLMADIVKQTCRHCHEHGHTEIVFVQPSEGQASLIFPVTVGARTRGSQFNMFLPVIQVPGMLIIKRQERVPGAYQKVVSSSIMDNWPIFVLALVTITLAGIIIWILDSSTNPGHFPQSFIQGSAQGFWWSFITMTTVGYGDRCPTSIAAKVFTVIWFVIGFIISTFFASAIAAMMTVTVVTQNPELQQTGNKLSAVANSTEYTLAVKSLSGKWKIDNTYESTDDLVAALRTRKTDAILVDMYLPLKRADMFNGSWFKVAQLIKADINHGILLSGEAIKLAPALKEFIAQNNVQTDYLSSGDDKEVSPPQETSTLSFFEIDSPYYVITAYTTIAMLATAIICGIVYEVMRRSRNKEKGVRIIRDETPKEKEPTLLDLYQVVNDFRDSFCGKFKAMKAKHRRQLVYLIKSKDLVITRF